MATLSLAAGHIPCDMQVDPECDLVARVARGDRRAFERLYGLYSRPVYSLAFRMLHDTQTAQDVAQEVFLGVWRGAAEFDPGQGTVRSWILALAHHKSVDAVRRRRLRTAEPLDEAVPDPMDAADEAMRRVGHARIRGALEALPEIQQETIVLAYYGGYTQREIARMLGLPLGTVKTRTRDGLTRLRRLLAAE